jgi:hypothetical protein
MYEFQKQILKQKQLPETLASKERVEVLPFNFADSSLVGESTDCAPLRWAVADRNISLNKGSLKQLFPVTSNL